MANTTIEHITLRTITEKTGFFQRKVETQEQICMKTPGGHIYLSEHTLNRGGDNWKLFQARLRENAREYHIPFEDLRTEGEL